MYIEACLGMCTCTLCVCVCVPLGRRKTVALRNVLIFGALQNPKCIPIYLHIYSGKHPGFHLCLWSVRPVCFPVPWDKAKSQYTCLNPTQWIRDRLWRGVYWWLPLRFRVYTCSTFHLQCKFRTKVRTFLKPKMPCLLSKKYIFMKTKALQAPRQVQF